MQAKRFYFVAALIILETFQLMVLAVCPNKLNCFNGGVWNDNNCRW